MFQNKKKEEKKMNEVNIKKKIQNITSKFVNLLEEKKNKRMSEIKNKKEQINQENKKSEINLESKEEIIENIEENSVMEENIVEENYSYIPVDVSELDDTFLEIAQNEIQEEELIIEKKQEKVEEEIEEEPRTKLNLELLETGRKSKKGLSQNKKRHSEASPKNLKSTHFPLYYTW